MKRSTVWAVWLVLLIFVGAAHAEMYRYKDADGNIRYTDDAASIPAHLRPQAKIIETSPSGGPTEAGAAGQAQGDQRSRAEIVNELEQKFAAEKQSLTQEKGELAKEGQRLQAEKEKLDARREEITSSRRFRGNRADSKAIRQLKEVDEEIRALDRKIQAHNQEVEAYNQRAKAFDKKVEEANEQYKKE